ncbi:TonB family protein [uncultured Brevundimonas sp.]|uniref:TonB family protein n=1 Tax=uncultured Brevundimonas sp. TaxID=213418 RepID=UPI0025FB0070|nr:TonB family protein [uncultured Brevundimonas sp.]
MLLLNLIMPQDVPTTAEPTFVELRQTLNGQAPEAEALGHTGKVSLEITVQPDGTRGPVTVIESSRSDMLDRAATTLIEQARIRAPATPTRYRATVEFTGADDAITCATMARQVRWYEQTWPERSATDTAIYSMSSGLLLLAGAPDTPNRASAQSAADRMQRLRDNFGQLVEGCEREPERPYFRYLGEWSRQAR